MVLKRAVLILLLTMFTLQVVAAADVAYIVVSRPNSDVVKIFDNLGLTYEIIKDKDVTTKNLNDYRLVFVDDGRVRKTSNLPLYNYPTIIMNRYYGGEWGLTDRDGISQLAATSPLHVRKDTRVLQVYTKATENNVGIAYYYLSDENKADMETIARTYIWGNEASDFGDVVAKANPGTRLTNGKTTQEKMCFYGIAKSKYWTQNAKDLLTDCIGFVITECDDDSQCDDSNDHTEDICENPGTINADCKNYPIVCLDETECGIDGFSGDNFCSVNQKDVLKAYTNYTCENAGTRDSSCSNVAENKVIEMCTDLCVNGACVDIECFNDSECNDNNQFTLDRCLNPGTVESNCTHTPIRCFENIDCNDNNSTTEDICLNPGTVDSSCTNNPIACHVNSDCGTDGYVHSPICSDGSVLQDYTTFKCNNGGTSQSFCSNTTAPKTKQVCEDSCSNGQCVIINCKNNADCSDNNTYTKDTCNFPNTPQSYCTYEDIECFNKNDCGVDGFRDGNYCSNATQSVVRDFETFSCDNPGTPASSCNSITAPKTVETCSEGESCLNGECLVIKCSKNSDCGINGYIGENYCSIIGDVVRDYKSYKCNQAGTPQSFCSNNVTTNVINECLGNQICVGRQQSSLINPPLPGSASTPAQCVDIECDSDPDCNDNNPRTVDECVNAGSPESYCRNTQVNCVKNSDCGYTGFLGGEFCSPDEEDILKTYQNATCNNAGTPQSFCTINKEDKLIQDCDDANIRTLDSCQEDAISLNPTCVHENIRCDINADCGSDGYITDLYCSASGDSVRDWKIFKCNLPHTPQSYCSSNVTQKVIDDCNAQEMCIDGSCEEKPPITCTKNTDCGADGYVGGLYCSSNGDAVRDYKTFTCNNPNTPQSYCSNNVAPQVVDDCSAQEQCNNGVCNPINIPCSTNSQCGTDGYIGNNYCSVNGDAVRDYKTFMCNMPGTPQSYCSNNVAPQVVDDCSAQEQCNNGVCNAPIECYIDADCNDNNMRTVDQCIFAGTPDSYCRNTEVNCLTNNDCGITGFMGSEFCYANDIYKTYQTSICKSPGTLNSYCDVSAGPQLVQDCEDNNPLTSDMCVPNPTAHCEHNIITCKKNSDCGTNGYVGLNYCLDSDSVARNYTAYLCNNPNTPQSYCSSNTQPLVNDNCDNTEICANGMCVSKENPECSDGKDNDGDLLIDYPNDKGCDSPTDDDERDNICPTGQSVFFGVTRLVANSTSNTVNQYDANTQAGISPLNVHSPLLDQSGNKLRNNFNIPKGTYITRIRDKAFSRWSNDNVNTAIFGGGPGMTWESSANVVYDDDGILTRTKFGRYFFATKQQAINEGVGKKALFYHNGGNIWIFIDDQPINDNRGYVDIELYSCPDTRQCNDKIDNDNDGLIDMQDPGCSNPDDDNESNPECAPYDPNANYDCEYYDTRVSQVLYTGFNNEYMCNYWDGGFAEKHIICYNHQWYEAGPTHDWGQFNGNFIPEQNVKPVCSQVGNWYVDEPNGIWKPGTLPQSCGAVV